MQSWPMHDAKARFSELIRCAVENGPQALTLYGQAKAVVVSRELFDQLSGNAQSLVDFMRASPLAGHDEIAFARDHGPGSLPREIGF